MDANGNPMTRKLDLGPAADITLSLRRAKKVQPNFRVPLTQNCRHFYDSAPETSIS